jgi:transposase
VPRKSPHNVTLSAEQRVELAVRLDTRREIVSKWHKRFFEQGLNGLEERPRAGRPPSFSP